MFLNLSTIRVYLTNAVGVEIKKKIAVEVLHRLSDDMFDVIKYHLSGYYSISLDAEDNKAFSLDQLHFGLSVLLGEGAANNILRQISNEINQYAVKHHLEA